MTPGNIVALLGTMLVLAIVPGPSDIAVVARADTAILMSNATVVVGGVKLGYAYAAERATSFFENATARRSLNMAAGTVMLGTGVYALLRG